MKINKGIQVGPRKVMVYGRHGMGKSSWGASAPKPLVIQTEDGCKDIDVHKTEVHATFESFMEDLEYLRSGEVGKVPYNSLVVDSMDWLEKLIHQRVASAQGVESIGDIPYGRGFDSALEYMRDVLRLLGIIQRKHDMHVVLVAHASIQKFDDPSSDAYDRYTPALHLNSKGKGVCMEVMEWCDEVFFLSEKVLIRKEDAGFGQKKIKAMSSGERILHTVSCPAFDAKSRLDMPKEIPFERGSGWSEYAKYFPKQTETKGEPNNG